MARSREWAVCVSLFGLLVLTVCFAQNLLRSIDVTEKAGITFSLDGEAQPEIEIGLFGSVVPKGVEFFKKMCNKPRGRGAFVEYTPIVQSLLKVMYFIEGNMSKTHIVPQRSIDIEENSVPHDTFAFGVGTNQEDKGYRFYITLGKNDHMNSKYLVLGRVMTQKRQLMNYSELYYQPIQMSEELQDPQQDKKKKKKKKKEKPKPVLAFASCRIIDDQSQKKQQETAEVKKDL